ncbi:hypothetical protein SAMN05216464_10595 [Mucilaginibacter pineti]|uniref:Uncharacterized protein n=1 Tax=Mucilaginibacter pineti TaxID=1391627 RepID=A0A1G7BMT7_9SPHI|nr:hypothetical protein [Mucilaginibacter pineti]SDE28471.1 hypothetical protein SAMN05216464_10595 [Mucilaginibacter pineti]
MSTVASNKEGTRITQGSKKPSTEKLKTEGPLSEKDEVKKAEEQMKKSAKKSG